MNDSNPIVKEFIKLNLVKKKSLSHVGFANRGIKEKVFKDIKSNIYLLEKNKISKNYYLNDRKMNFNEVQQYLKTLYQDDKRRFNQFKHILNGKKIIVK